MTNLRSVKEWLERFDLVEHHHVFVENEIDLDAARDLSEQDLRELGLAMGPRKKLLRAIATLNERDPANRTFDGKSSASSSPGVAVLGDRRQVTVLFADICGYTKLSGELGAENTHAMLATYFDAVDGIVKSFGGSVDKHIGDSVMAVFGAPVSHGNDPERAIRTAAAIHEAMPTVSRTVGRDIKVHIGVASGEVVASGVGASESYTVTGESVNLASRLTDRAGPSETLISEMVMQAVDGRCRTEELGTLSLKGIAKTIRAFRLLELLDGPTRANPFVGRQAELQQLKAVLDATAETAAGHAIYLRGEAGIGKTRIAEEIGRLASLQAFTCHRALVLDFGAGKGQDAIRSLVRSLLCLNADLDEDARKSAVESALSSGVISKDQIVFLNDLLDLPQPAEFRSVYSAMDNARRKQGTSETVAGIVRRISEDQMLLLVVEDVHWADKLVLHHLAELTRAISDRPVVLAMTSRLEGDQIDDAWRATTGSTPIITVDLRPLRHADAIVLASKFLDATESFAKSCVERAGGNPLFLEQLLRGAETAAEDAVPGSIQSIVQARVDALAPADKLAIQAAATLGQRFTLEALQHVVDDPAYNCSRLIDRYLVRPDGEALLFSHALVRDGVYNSLLRSTQSKLHERAAHWYRDRDPILHAQHLDRASNPDAARAYLHAARGQADSLRFETAIALCRRALELAADEADLCDLNCVLGDALLNTRATEPAIKAFEAAARRAPDAQRKAKALSGLASALRIADRHAPAFAALDEAEQFAKKQSLDSELAYIHYLRGNLCFPLGRIDECMAEHEKSLRLAEKIQSPEAQARALSGLADAHYLRGHMRTACERFKACVELCQQHGFGQLEVANRHMIGWTRIHLMQFRPALQDGLQLQAMASEVRNDRALMFGKTLVGIMQYELGDLEQSEAALHDAAALAKSMSSNNGFAQTLRALALVKHKQDHLKEARAYAEEALAAVRKAGMTFIGPAVLATCAIVCEDKARREHLLNEAEGMLERGCVAHNQVWFAEIGIDDAVARQDWGSTLRYADLLERHTQTQPLEWSTFMIRRARALARAGQGDKSHSTITELQLLVEQASICGLVNALPALAQAIA
jgi:class 3 adenylate cyclase/predicted ATPase